MQTQHAERKLTKASIIELLIKIRAANSLISGDEHLDLPLELVLLGTDHPAHLLATFDKHEGRHCLHLPLPRHFLVTQKKKDYE